MPTMYPHYLQTDCWASIRHAVLKRANFVCEAREVCQGARATDAHHLTYENIGNEPLNDLLAVCRACHRALHGLAPEQRAAPVAANDNKQLDLFAKVS